MKAVKSPLWSSIEELAQVIMSKYTVTTPTREEYLAQVNQYPLYMEWFEWIMEFAGGMLLELGPGPGILAERCAQSERVQRYFGLEPDDRFIAMTKAAIGDKGIIIKGVSERYLNPGAFDYIVGTAWYHHSEDKLKSLKNCFTNLKSGGSLVIADGFLPEYEWRKESLPRRLVRIFLFWLRDCTYTPANKVEFVESNLQYAAAQLLAMPAPDWKQIVDQMRTWFLDTVRIEELKVCVSILKDQLERAGFIDISVEHMIGYDPRVNYEHLGYYFVTAKKP